MNRKLRKFLKHPVLFVLDMKALSPVWAKLGVKRKVAKIIPPKQIQRVETPVEANSQPGWDAFELVGENWEKDDKEILVFFGFSPWKRAFISEYFSQYRTAFARGKTGWPKLRSSLANKEVHALVLWGMYGRAELLDWAASKGTAIWRMEDGFLRSVGLGSQHIKPLSLVLDKRGLYFDSTHPSDLEELISRDEALDDPTFMSRAEKNIRLITELGISKYNFVQRVVRDRHSPPSEYTILVIGQVEDDASIAYGCAAKASNLDLIRAARNDYPEANIIYRPHPDVTSGHREQISDLSAVEALCTVSTEEMSLSEMLECADHVYTITSLVGMEAYIRGLKVTTLGLPFYAGWGEVESRETCGRRTVKRTAAQVFGAAYIRYPVYHVGLLQAEAQIEHAILALFLESEGIPTALAGLIASGCTPEDIDIALARNLVQLIRDKEAILPTLVPVLTGLEDAKTLVSLLLRKEPLTELVVNKIELEVENESLFELALLFAKKEERPDLLLRLNSLSHTSIPLGGAAPYVRCLILAGDLPSAEAYLHKSLISMDELSAEQLLAIFQIFGLVHAEQGKFGRKPIADEEAVSKILEVMPSFNRHPRIGELVFHSISYLGHHRLWRKAEGVSASLLQSLQGGKDIDKWLLAVTGVVKAFTALSKRPELGIHAQLAYANELYEEVEAKLFNYYATSAVPVRYQIDMAYLATLVKPVAEQAVLFDKILLLLEKRKLSQPEINKVKSLISSHFVSLAKATRYSDALKMLARAKKLVPEEFYYNLAASAHAFNRNYGSAEKLTLVLLKKYKKLQYRRKLANILERAGELPRSREVLLAAEAIASNSAGLGVLKELELIQGELARVQFLLRSTQILRSVPQPRLPKGVVFVTSFGCLNSISMMIPVLRELRSRGYAVIQVDEGMLVNDPTGIEWIDRHGSRINRVLHTDVDLEHGLENAWEISWNERKVISNGVNFYQGIFEIMTQRLRSYNFDINDPGVFRWFRHYLVRSDRALSVCLDIKRTVMARGMPVRFINCGSHSAPFSVYRSFSLHESEKYNVGFIHMGPAYENYYSNLKNKFASTVCADNLTKYPNYRLPFLARPDLFESWLGKKDQYSLNKDAIDRVLNMNRVGKQDTHEISVMEERIAAFKAAGRRIIGVYGKILCDMAVPYDGGPGHASIVDWLRHTVEIANNTDNVIVLKPHPHELRPEIARDLNEYWLDLVDVAALPNNVIVLPHQGMNNQDLIKYLDLAVLWNGTSSLELLAQGVPVVMASYFGQHDYPVEMIYPADRRNYEEIVCGSDWERPDEDKMKRSALLLHYMGTDEVCVPFTYSYRPVTNDPVGVPYWHEAAIDQLVEKGDPHISRLADKFF